MKEKKKIVTKVESGKIKQILFCWIYNYQFLYHIFWSVLCKIFCYFSKKTRVSEAGVKKISGIYLCFEKRNSEKRKKKKKKPGDNPGNVILLVSK